MPKIKLDVESRFWSRVDIGSPQECWPWNASYFSNGYGRISINHKWVKANRVAWKLSFGEIPTGVGYHGICVLHKCDNRACVNPSHLFIGTHAENIADMCAKGRHARKLSDADVQEIKNADGTHSEIAKRFGIARSTVTHIRTGRIWNKSRVGSNPANPA